MSVPDLTFTPDELDGFEQATIALPSEGDGPLCATLVRRQDTPPRPAVLYVHGFADYFFQSHLADAVQEAGFAFYALDLRRYGRSLRPGNRANQARDISDYFAEIDQAFSFLLAHHGRIGGWIQHSMGALVADHYLERGRHQGAVPCVVQNSPFLRFHLRPRERALTIVVAGVGRVLPQLRIPQRLTSAYGLSIHESGVGCWSYSLERKPLEGFPLYAGWFTMIRRAQRQLRRGLDLPHPLLVLHSSSSRYGLSEQPGEDDMRADIVVDVGDIRRIAPRLGRHVQLREIQYGMHDLYLSAETPRSTALDATVAFLKKYGQPQGAPSRE